MSVNQDWIVPQKKAFTVWVNTKLNNRNININVAEGKYVDTAFTDGIWLIVLLEELSGTKIGHKYRLECTTRIQRVENITVALEFAGTLGLVKGNTLGVEDFLDSREKPVLGFVWTLFKHYGRAKTDGAQSAMLDWCREMTQGYAGVEVNNFTNSWVDGLALCALLHHVKPELIEFEKLTKENALDNLNLAFNTAFEQYRIPKLLDAQDLVQYGADAKAVEMYLTLYYNAFHTEASMGSANASIESLRETQSSLEHRVTDMSAELAHLDEIKHKLEDELHQTSDTLDETKNNLLSEKSRREELERALAAANEEHDKLAHDLHGLQADKERLEGVLKNEELALERKTEDYNAEVKQHHDTREELEKTEAELAKAQANVAHLESEIARKAEEDHRAEELRLSLQTAGEKEIAKLVDENKAVRDEIFTVKHEKDVLQEELTAEKATSAKLKEEGIDWKAKYEALVIEIEKERKVVALHITDLEGHINSLESDLKQEVALTKSLRQEVATQQEELNTRARLLEQEKREVAKQKAYLQLTRSDFQVLLSKLENMYDHFEDPLRLAKVVFSGKVHADVIEPNLDGQLAVRIGEGMFSGFHQRYLVLKDNFVFIFKDNSHHEPVLVVRLDKSLVSNATEGKQQFLIRLKVADQKDVWIDCATEEDRNEWMEGISVAMHFWDPDTVVGSAKAQNARDPLALACSMMVQFGLPSNIQLTADGFINVRTPVIPAAPAPAAAAAAAPAAAANSSAAADASAKPMGSPEPRRAGGGPRSLAALNADRKRMRNISANFTTEQRKLSGRHDGSAGGADPTEETLMEEPTSPKSPTSPSGEPAKKKVPAAVIDALGPMREAARERERKARDSPTPKAD